MKRSIKQELILSLLFLMKILVSSFIITFFLYIIGVIFNSIYLLDIITFIGLLAIINGIISFLFLFFLVLGLQQNRTAVFQAKFYSAYNTEKHYTGQILDRQMSDFHRLIGCVLSLLLTLTLFILKDLIKDLIT